MTHRDISDGERETVTLRFLSRRTALVGGRRVQRLYFECPDGDTVEALVPPDRFGAAVGLRTGNRYRLARAHWCLPPADIEDGLAGGPDGESACPDCGGRLRAAGAVDRSLDAADRVLGAFDVEEPFLLVGREATLEPADGSGEFHRGGTTDGSGEATNGSARRHGGLSGPDGVVCTDCGRRFGVDGAVEGSTSWRQRGDR
jgi:hypothetical protein